MFNDDTENSDATSAPPTEEAPSASNGDVVRMVDFNTVRPGQILLELRAYWESLRKGRAIPDRSDVEPRGIRAALDYAFILERIAPGAARFRLAGRHLVDLMGMEVRGMPLCALLNPPSRGRLSDVLESVFKAPQIAELQLSSPGGYARPELTGKMLILPLKSDLGDVTRALGCVIAEGEIGRGPRRFDLISDQVFPVIAGALVLEPSPSAHGFTEAAPNWRPSRPAPKVEETPEERRARFKLVSDKD
ncbi:PAS domain-containing protein [Paracoccus sp. (in: a-proteobacteria)]|uniref:PAS domain-containing protein n=1 Tax=Paracoccus sp. TaxID=267 RepID=UPI00289E30B1|nr:PAS domain-containing protein [Paracoccus sp. (in: a-proteobacteria)]